MNCAYRLIWNDRFGAWCVVPEIASARGKRSGGGKQCAATLLLTLALGSSIAGAADLSATALPGGGQVAAGQAAISSSGAAMTISQGSQRAIINWQNFDIGSQASVNFQQPDASAVALNRVNGPTISRIEGQLSANGQVFLVNPNGVLFGNGARVNVGGLVASTLNIRDADFLSGNYTFSGTGGSITNQGKITAAPGGYLAFIAPTITNNGSINAPQGTVAMGAGERVRLNFAGDRLVGLDVNAGTIDALITNNQAIRAEGGAILLTAAGAEAVTRSVINNNGVLEASSLTSDGGRIALTAGSDINLGAGSSVTVDGKKGGEITVQAKSGTLLADGSVSARGAEGSGGAVQLLGHQVGLIDAAQVDASGATGGGTVLIGGDYQGSNAAVQNAFRTYVGPQATIKADALHQGDGGKVVVWADDATRFAGTISVRGGANGGDGGFVEVSGKGALDFQGLVDTRAPQGKTGTLLLDPTDITISGAASTPTVTSGGGNFSDPATTPSNVNVNTLVTQLGASNVTVSTASGLAGNGDITVNNAINYNSANSLTLNANRSITVVAGSGGINNAGGGAVTLTGAGTGSITVNEGITTSGGAISLTSGSGGVTLAAAKAIDAGSGAVAITSVGAGNVNLSSGTLRSSNAGAAAISVTTGTGAMTLGNVALTGGGSLSVNHGGAGAQTTGTTISGNGGLTKAGVGALALSQVNSYTGTTTVNAGALTLSGGNAIADTGAVVLADAAGVSLNVNSSEILGSLAGGGASGGNVTKSTAGAAILTVGRNGASTTFGGVVQNGSGTVSLVKEGAGTLTLTGANTYTGATGVSGGTLALTGATGSAIGTAFTINQGARLLLDNAAANNNRIAGAVTMNGGELAITGNAGANTTETIGALTFNSGYSTVTLTPDAARNTQVTFASLARPIDSGAAVLFRGTNLGANAVTSQTAGSSNIVITTAPTLTGGGGNAGTSTVSIVAGAIGDASATGTGTDFVTYNPPTGSVNGLRPLLASEYAATPAANVNLRLAANRTADDTFSINSLLLAGGVTYNFDNAAGANTLTVTSGNILSLGAGNTLQPAQNAGTLAFGTVARPNVFTVGDLTLGSNLAVTGNRVLGKSGAGTLLENRAVARTGGIVVNSGTLRSGVANAFASQAVTVRAGGVFDLNGFNNTVSGLTLESGATAGAAVSTGAGTLTLAGNLGLNFNGTGATGATISGNLTETVTRTYVVNDGVAADDLTIAAVISGAGGVTKTGNGTLALVGANSYTGITTISAGTLSANTLANGSAASSIGASTSAAANLVFGGGTLQYTGGTASTNRDFTLNAGTTDSIRVTNAATNLTISGASTNTTGALTKAGAGTLTLSGANLNTGTTTVAGGTLALGASNALASGGVTVTGGATFDIGTFSDSVGTVTLTNGNITGTTGTLTGTSYALQNGLVSAVLGGTAGLTKTTAGTVTLSGANTYTGATAVNAGVLSVSSLANGGGASNIGASTNAAANLVLGGGTLRFTGATASTDRNYTLTTATTSAIEVTNPATNLTVSGASTNTTGALTKLGDGTLTLTGSNVNSGATTIRAGTLQVGNGGTTGSLGTGGVTNLGRLVFNRSNALTVANVVSSFGELVKEGSGTTTLTGANTYTGATTINAGTLALNATGTIARSSGVANNGTFTTAAAKTIDSMTGTGNTVLGGTLTIGDASNTSSVYGGVISGTGGITKAGTGTLTLSGANTYTGVTTISAGTLVAANAAALGGPASGTTVANGAVLRVDNVALNAEAVTLQAGGTLSGNGAASLAGNVTQTGAATLTATSGGTLTLNGAVNAGGFSTTISGPGSVVATNAANDFSSVAIASAQNVSLRDANNLAFAASTVGGTLTAAAGGTLTLNGALSAAGTGDTIVLSGSRFVNSAGPGALTATNGRWLVWSGNPNPFGGATPDNRGGLAYDFKQYNATYGVTPVAQPTGNGFLYAYAPTITPGLTGMVTKVYDGNTTALLAPANLIASGAVDGDTVVLAATSSTYDNRNVGTGKTVTATGITATASNGTATVYGYTVLPTSASGPVGEITPAALSVTSIAGVSTTYGTVAATGAVTLGGVIGSDVVTSTASLVSPTYSTSGNLSAGSYAQSASSLGGADAGNYTLTGYTTPTANYVVNQLALTGSISVSDKVYDSTTAASITSRSLSGVIAGDSVSYIGGVANFSNKNVGNAKTVTASGLGLSGPDAGNYTVNGAASTTANITPAPLVLNAVSDSKVYDGNTGSNGVVGAVGLQGSDGVSNLNQSYTSKNVLGTNASTLTVNGGYSVNDGNGGANYTVITQTAQGTITPAPLTIAANDANKSFGAPNPPFSATYTGFVGGETSSVLNGVLSFRTLAGTTSPPGNYAITPFGQTSSNYAIVYRDGVLTINGGPIGPGDAGVTGADQQAIGAQYTSQGTPTLALAKIQYIGVEGDCVDETATAQGGCKDQPPGTSLVRVVNGGISMPRQ